MWLQMVNYKVEPGAIIYPNCEIGEGSIIGANAVLRPYTVIGNNTIFGTLACSEGHNKIGDNCTIHAQSHITSRTTIGNNCFIGAFFLATNTRDITKGKHGTKTEGEPNLLPTVIEDNVIVGACVNFIPGITIGHDSLIYQNTLITKDVPPYSIVKGGKGSVGQVIGSTK